jgi:CheY-like chemotaxis protein
MSDSNRSGTILLVEDDADIRESMIEMLELEGFRVLGAKDGQEALQILSRRGDTSLVLLDLMMPGMNGWEFLEARTRNSSLSPIPVIVVSAAADDRVTERGAEAYLTKPVDIDHLLRLVEKHAVRTVA